MRLRFLRPLVLVLSPISVRHVVREAGSWKGEGKDLERVVLVPFRADGLKIKLVCISYKLIIILVELEGLGFGIFELRRWQLPVLQNGGICVGR